MGDIGEHYRDVRAAKKQRAQRRTKTQPPAPKRRCYDWMVVSGNTHYAKNRSSFTTYRRVRRSIPGSITGETFVAGIGTVELKVRTRRDDPESPDGTLVLENVLHIPSAICNGMALELWAADFGASTDNSREGWDAWDRQNRPVWYGERFHGGCKLALAGNPQGESYLGDGLHMLSIYVPKDFLDEVQEEKQTKEETRRVKRVKRS
ncbi:hypothetical protein BJX66DRAFT_297274 [Aspergillus keveii]|uniref:Uncharacterized protein n=1 Tax=Aspergillus keveii TaxID=714993 RepID=A0ABR4GFT8_9EURO